jgi:hypothetical protein
MENHFYNCDIVIGNMSIFETEQMKEAMEHFLHSFYYRNFSFEKLEHGEGAQDYCYQVGIRYKHHNRLRVLRFSESLKAFCLFHNMSVAEHCLA